MGILCTFKVAKGTAYGIFLIPVILSLVLGSAVLGQVLQEPDRELDMIPNFKFTKKSEIIEKPIKIIGVQSQYDIDSPIIVQVQLTDTKFDCGDLYITIYDMKTNKPVVQSGFFDQCYAADDLLMPIGEEFSETVDATGNYEIVVEFTDKQQKDTLSATSRFTVK